MVVEQLTWENQIKTNNKKIDNIKLNLYFLNRYQLIPN